MIVQGTEEWKQARLGIVTASRLSDVMAKGKSGEPSRTRAAYMAELICERLTGQPYDGFQSADMLRGNEVEAEAKAAYTFMTDAETLDGGFDLHPAIPEFGASPDMLVGNIGLAEFKCPKTSTHLDTIMTGKIDREYLLQMQGQMACTGREWVDFCSFDPRLPSHLRMWTFRVQRDADKIAEIEGEVKLFLAEMDVKLAKLNAKLSAEAA